VIGFDAGGGRFDWLMVLLLGIRFKLFVYIDNDAVKDGGGVDCAKPVDNDSGRVGCEYCVVVDGWLIV
jgi:hypothetical protein